MIFLTSKGLALVACYRLNRYKPKGEACTGKLTNTLC